MAVICGLAQSLAHLTKASSAFDMSFHQFSSRLRIVLDERSENRFDFAETLQNPCARNGAGASNPFYLVAQCGQCLGDQLVAAEPIGEGVQLVVYVNESF